MTTRNRPELPPEGKRETSAGTPPASALQGRGALAGTKPKTCTQQDGARAENAGPSHPPR